MNRWELLQKANTLPTTPGVYIMKNAEGTVIYVGKSKALKNRVSSYFLPSANHVGKTLKMVSSVHDFDIYHTATELEALLLENRFIKQYMPKYNIKLKDSKGYPYICVTSEEYPRITVENDRVYKDAKYFGPFSSAVAAMKIIDVAKRAFMLPTCNKKFPNDIKKSSSPCLNYHIKRCGGVCVGNVSASEYNERISDAVHVFKGDYGNLASQLTEKMNKASENLDFENAAKYRDFLLSIKKIGDKQHIVAGVDTEADIIGVYADEMGGSIVWLFVRGGAITDKEELSFGAKEIITSESLVSLLIDFYKTRQFIPKEIWIDYQLENEDADLLSTFFREEMNCRSNVLIPKIGDKKRLSSQASTNAKESVLRERREKEKKGIFLAEFSKLLNLPSPAERIEAYDISNSGDDFITASMIVLCDGKFQRGKYRTFNIRTTSGQDDFGSMREALERRLSHKDKDWEYPDLILVDGGAGQVNAVKEIVNQFNAPISVFGMVKDEHHKTRTLTDGVNEISIAHLKDVYTFVYKIQEEAHRVAISRMDAKRRKVYKKSSLENIKGVGEKTAKALLDYFGGLKAIKNASIEELSAVKGVSRKAATAIKDYYNKSTGK